MTSSPTPTPSSRPSPGPSAPRSADNPGGRLLLVGDGRALPALAAAGYDTVVVGAERLPRALPDGVWELVLVGWSQDGVDALAACAEIRAHPRCLDVPVLVQASVEHGDRPADALAAGADDYVVTPWEPVELLTRVRLALTARRVSGAESRWHALVANLPGAVYRCELDEHWTMHYLSDQVHELTGYAPAELVGSARRTFASVIHPDDRAAVEADVTAAVERGEPFVSYYRIVRADGRVRHVVDRGRLVAGRHGRRWLDGFVADVTAQKDAERRLRDTLAEQAAAEERARLARDLHDSVSQSLFSMTLHARAAQLALQRAGHPEGDATHRSVAELRDLSQAALAEMRALIFELRPGALADEGLVSALRKHAAAIAAREALPVTVEAPEGVTLEPDAEEALYRLAQEALHNAVKHAGASRVTVTVEPLPGDRLAVEVRDDGAGFDTGVERPGHLGLVTMRERAERAGGTLHISSGAGQGTRVRAEVPTRRASTAL